MNRTLENDLSIAFEHASIEEITKYMNDIDESQFENLSKFSIKRIQSSTLKKMGIGKKSKNGNLIIKTISTMAASIAIILTILCTFSVEARALLKQMFSFIPGIGIVESYDEVYVLSEPVVSTENAELFAEINRAVVEDDCIMIEYKTTLKNVDIDRVNHTVLEEDPRTALVEYYALLGYDKYFELDHELEMKAISSLEIQGHKLERVETETFLNEGSGMKYALVTETYNLDGLTVSDVKDAKLSIGTLSVNFTLQKAKVFSTKEEALEGKLICKKDGIELVCETKWIANTLVASFYTVHEEQTEVVSLFPYYLSEDAGAYLHINGKIIEGQFANNEVNVDSRVFWLHEDDIHKTCTITIPVIAVKNAGEADDSEYLLESNFIFEIKE